MTISSSHFPSLRHFIDAHCHLADPRISDSEESLHQILARSQAAGVTRWIQGGVDPADWDRQEQLSLRFPGQVIPCFGLHPWWVARQPETEIKAGLHQLKKRATNALGIGELGLDFYFAAENAKQLYAFENQLKLACQLNKPIILHIVKAHEPALALLKQVGVPKAGGLVHSFSGSPEIARRYLELGLTLSISGVIARKGFESLKRAVVKIPPQSLVVETDSPDQTPEPLQKHNEPANLVRIAEAIANLRDESATELLERSTENLEKIFGLRK